MNDRELLRMAAKAAGIELVELDECQDVLPDGTPWNPLTDDGDALRLAVELDISVSPGRSAAGATWWVRPGLIEQAWVSEPHEEHADPYAATRRALVRAAAEIGKAVKTPTWHSGPPPSIGWWPASVETDYTSIRWWNGKHWSARAHPSYSAKQAASYARIRSAYENHDIHWSARWWE